jgi:hypothetical protein
MSARNLPGGSGRPGRKADNFTAICEATVLKMWEPRRLLTGIALPFYILIFALWMGDGKI